MSQEFATPNRRPPPAGLATSDDQGVSELCVRYAIGKALANLLFINNKIDVEQLHIMNCLVQEKKSVLKIHPKEYKDIELFLQDKQNECKDGTGTKIPNKSWWKVYG